MGLEDVLAVLSELPLGALIQLGEAVAHEVNARNEQEAMKAAVKAIDAEADALEEEALK